MATKAQHKLGIVFDSESDDDDNDLDPTNYEPKPWGTSHPCFDWPDDKKVHFSKAEKQYLRSKVLDLKHVSGKPAIPHNFVSKCLKFIWKDDLAVPIFHKRHILKADRLRSCFKSFKIGIK